MTVQTSFNSATTSADALDTLNAALSAIAALTTKVAAIPPLASIGAVSQNEGNSGTTAFVFPVTLDKVWSSDMIFEYVTVASATLPASASDFVGGAFPRGIVTVPAGSLTANLSIPVAANTAVEPNKNFIVRLYRVAASSLGTILNDDAAPAITSGVIAQVGDSRAAGQGASYKYIDKLGYGTGVTIANGFSASGHTVGVFGSTPGSGGIDIATDVPNGIASLYQSGKPNVVLITRGLNDTRYYSTAPATIYENMKQYAAFYRAQGFRPIFMTECYYTDVTGTTLANAQNDITALNNLIIANADSDPTRRADGVVDLRSLVASNGSAIGTLTAPNDTSVYSDKIHGTNLWHDAVAAAVKPVTDAVLAMTALTPNVVVPGAPVLTATAGTGGNLGKIVLSWTDNVNSGSAIANHDLYQGTASSNETLVGTISATSPVVVSTGLTAGTPAFFKIKARNVYGAVSAFSNEVSATPAAATANTIIDATFDVASDTAITAYTDSKGNSFAGMPLGGGIARASDGKFYPDATGSATGNGGLYGPGQYCTRIPANNSYSATWVSKFTSPCAFLFGMNSAGTSFLSVDMSSTGNFGLRAYDPSYQNARKDIVFNAVGVPTTADYHTLVATVSQGTGQIDIVVTLDGVEILRGSEAGVVQSPGYIGTRTLNRMLLDRMTVAMN